MATLAFTYQNRTTGEILYVMEWRNLSSQVGLHMSHSMTNYKGGFASGYNGRWLIARNDSNIVINENDFLNVTMLEYYYFFFCHIIMDYFRTLCHFYPDKDFLCENTYDSLVWWETEIEKPSDAHLIELNQSAVLEWAKGDMKTQCNMC